MRSSIQKLKTPIDANQYHPPLSESSKQAFLGKSFLYVWSVCTDWDLFVVVCKCGRGPNCIILVASPTSWPSRAPITNYSRGGSTISNLDAATGKSAKIPQILANHFSAHISPRFSQRVGSKVHCSVLHWTPRPTRNHLVLLKCLMCYLECVCVFLQRLHK